MWAQAGLRAAGLAGAVLRVGTAAGADRASGTSVPRGLDPDTAAGKLASWQALQWTPEQRPVQATQPTLPLV
jgi:hypothetical protein